MSITKMIHADLISAMKSKDELKVSTLRMLKAALGTVSIDKKKNELDDPEAIGVLQKQAKQRRESQDSFEKAGRKDLAQKEEKELRIIESYLPVQMSDDEIKKLVVESILKVGATLKTDIGNVMKDLMPKVKGKADGKKVNEIVQSLLK